MKNKLLFIKRLDFIKRHWMTYYPSLSFKKVGNIILNEIEMRRVVSMPRSLPPFIKIEPTPLCHLRCTGCSQRKPEFKRKFNSSMHLTLENLKKIIEPISDTLLGVSLSMFGEPMLNKNIVSLIEYLKSKKIGVSFPTNFSINLSEEQAENLVKSGLDTIMICLDGVSEETYSKYRVGGNFNLVVKNVKMLADMKKKFGLKRPHIVWKFIVFDYNQNEVETVRKTYKTLGFNSYEFVHDFFSESTLATKKTLRGNKGKDRKPCYWLWNTMIIRWNGRVNPCCSHLDLFDIGNVIDEDIIKVWRNDKYRALRDGFNKKEYGRKMHPLCKKCYGLTE